MTKYDTWRDRERIGDVIAGRRSGPSRLLIAALAAAGGFAAAYLFDPERGRTRRATLGDRAAAGMRDLGRTLDRGSRMAGLEAIAVGKRVKHAGGGQVMPSDAALSDKVETELFADPAIPQGKININVEEGVVVLRGEVDHPGQADKLIKRAESIPGVTRVDSLLHLPGEPAPPEPPREHATVTTAGPEGELP